jgi:hypothetical protein
MWLYLDELQFNFEFRSGRMIFGWVMVLELVFFVQILSCPEIGICWFSTKHAALKSKSRYWTTCRFLFQWASTIKNKNSESIAHSNTVFFVQILSCLYFFFDVLWDIDLIFGMWLYLDELQYVCMLNTSKLLSKSHTAIGFYVKTMSAHGSHLGWRSWSPDTILKVYYPWSLSGQFSKFVFSDPDLHPRWPPSADIL